MTCHRTCQNQPCPTPWECYSSPLIQEPGLREVDSELPTPTEPANALECVGWLFKAAVISIAVVALLAFVAGVVARLIFNF